MNMEKINIYCKKDLFKEIKRIIHTYYPLVKLSYMGYLRKTTEHEQEAYTDTWTNTIYFFFKKNIDEHAVLHEVNHIRLKRETDLRETTCTNAELINILHVLSIYAEFLADKEVFKKNKELIDPIIKKYVNQGKKSLEDLKKDKTHFNLMRLYFDFLTLVYLYKIKRKDFLKQSIKGIKKELPEELVRLSDNLLKGKDLYRSLDVILSLRKNH